MRRLILFVEGEGEADAVPTLLKRLLKEKGERFDILLDDSPFRVGSVDKLVKDDFAIGSASCEPALSGPMSAGSC
jgi:hypothetical protein